MSKARTSPNRATQEVQGGLDPWCPSRYPEVTTRVKASQCLTTRLPRQSQQGSQVVKMPMSFTSILFIIKKSPLLSVSPRSREFLLLCWEAPTAGSQSRMQPGLDPLGSPCSPAGISAQHWG